MPGQLVYLEMPAADVERARSFFGALLGWKIAPWQGDYQTIEGAGPQAGIVPSEQHHPTIYFDVDDIESSLRRVRELGGEADDIQEIPTVGRFAACRDDQGVHFSLFEAGEGAE